MQAKVPDLCQWIRQTHLGDCTLMMDPEYESVAQELVEEERVASA